MKIYKDQKKQIEIFSVQDWLLHCPPANSKTQWCDYRSAKEMAKFWTNPECQKEFLLFLQQMNRNLTFEYALPEVATRFDNYRNARKNDLCIFANEGYNKVLILIEGKADEPFGNYIAKEWSKCDIEKNKNQASRKLDRVIDLQKRFNDNKLFVKLRYQLVYWFAGAIEEAKRNNIDKIYLVVQEFHSKKTTNKKIETNKIDLNSFVEFISHSAFREVNEHEIVGPINNEFTKQIDLYIGKHQTQI